MNRIVAPLTLIALVGAAPAQTPLKTIARVHASMVCSNMARNANAAITAANADDNVIGQMIALLSPSSLQNVSDIRRRAIVKQLQNGGIALTKSAQAGEGAVVNFFMLMPPADTADQQKSIQAFSKALNTALHRQEIFGQGLAGFAKMLSNHDVGGLAAPKNKAEDLGVNVSAAPDPNNPYNDNPRMSPNGLYRQTSIQNNGVSQGQAVPPPVAAQVSDVQIAEAATSRLGPFVGAIAKDETDAMNALDGTIPGCNP